MEIKIQKKFIRMSPDKIRPAVNLVRGWKIEKAISELNFLKKRAGLPVLEVLKSSLAAAKDKDIETDDLYIKSIICNEGPRLKRRRIIHRGRATAINKRMSHIIVIISTEKDKKNPAKKTNVDKDAVKVKKENIKSQTNKSADKEKKK